MDVARVRLELDVYVRVDEAQRPRTQVVLVVERPNDDALRVYVLRDGQPFL
jgi:hypothetical protein